MDTWQGSNGVIVLGYGMTWMDNYEFMEILKHLVKEKKDLQKRLDVLEEILHSHLPIIENKDKES